MKVSRSTVLNVTSPLLGTAALLSGIFLRNTHHYLLGFIILACAFLCYFTTALANQKNWLDIRAVFSGVWLGTVGLAALRLLNYQKVWQAQTWLWIAVAYAVFQIGTAIGIAKGAAWQDRLQPRLQKFHIGRLHFVMQPQRLFTICIVTTVIGILTFIANIWIRGYIPCFSPDPHAYVTFYSKVQIFSVAATGISGLCYYVIRTQPIGKWKKALLYLCILYHIFAYPILIASRGTFMASAVSLMVVIFYLHKKKFLALVLSIVVIFSVYSGCSFLRNYTNSQLSAFFEPSEIILPGQSEIILPGQDEDSEDGDGIISFSLPPRVAWVYSYLTVSHDNFNEAVQNTTDFTYGTRQLVPINVILRSSAIEERNEQAETHLVREHLNTNNLIGDFYYDFGGIGVIVSMLLWSVLFGINQSIADKQKGWISLLLLGNTLVPVILCFFSSWTSVFSQWMLWGVVFLFAIAGSVTRIPKQND